MRLLVRQRTPALGLLLTIALATLAGVAEASDYQREALALAGVATVMVFACIRPGLYIFVLAAMFLVPYSWSPTLINAPTPAIMLLALPAGVAAVVILMHRGRLPLCVFDYLVMAIFITAIFSEIATASAAGILGSHTLTHNELEVLLLPYFAFRLILAAWPRVVDRLPLAVMVAGAALSLVAIWEEITRTNLFANSGLNNPELAVWEHTFPRAGGVRADAAMGHPIALGSFLIIPLVFAFGQRRWGLFALLAVGEALTLSRGPYIAAFVALVLCSILTRRMGRLWGVICVVVLLGFFVGPVRNSVTNSFQAGSKEAKTANYRSELLGTSLGSVTVWGKPSGRTDELYASQQGQVKLPDVTSELALMSGRQGIFGLTIWIGFLLSFVYVIWEARRRSDSLLLFLGVALTAEWVALLSVALITSFQYAFWLMVAMTAVRLRQSPLPPTLPETGRTDSYAQLEPLPA